MVDSVQYNFFKVGRKRTSHLLLHAKSLQLCVTLWDPVDCSPPGSSVHKILQARILEWVAISFSRGSSQPRDRTQVSCGSYTAGRFFTAEPPGEALLTITRVPKLPPLTCLSVLHSSPSWSLIHLPGPQSSGCPRWDVPAESDSPCCLPYTSLRELCLGSPSFLLGPGQGHRTLHQLSSDPNPLFLDKNNIWVENFYI